MSFVTAVALLSTYLTTPYWLLMNSTCSYGKFPPFVKKMKSALNRWSSAESEIEEIMQEEPVFGEDFKVTSRSALDFLITEYCDKSLVSKVFKEITGQFSIVMVRQFADLLPGEIYDSTLQLVPGHIQDLLETCLLTNLIGERLLGDLDYDMKKRRKASTFFKKHIE